MGATSIPNLKFLAKTYLELWRAPKSPKKFVTIINS